MCVHGAIRQTNMATDSFNIYLSPVGVTSLDRFAINWQAGAKLIRHVRQYNGFETLNVSAIKNVMTCLKGNRGNTGSRGYGSPEIPLNVITFLIADVFRVTKPSRSFSCRISLAPACQLMTHVTTNFRLNRDQCICKLAVVCLDKSIYFNNI